MKKIILLLATLFSLTFAFSQADSDYQTIIHEATYKGQNLFVKNPMSSSVGYSLKRVVLNEKELRLQTDESMVEIKLDEAGLKEGDDYKLELIYFGDSKPEIQ